MSVVAAVVEDVLLLRSVLVRDVVRPRGAIVDVSVVAAVGEDVLLLRLPRSEEDVFFRDLFLDGFPSDFGDFFSVVTTWNSPWPSGSSMSQSSPSKGEVSSSSAVAPSWSTALSGASTSIDMNSVGRRFRRARAYVIATDGTSRITGIRG